MALACHPERSEGSVALGVEMPHLVTLSAAKGLSRWVWRCFAALSMTMFVCHPERSEGSVTMGVEMLRCTQHDSMVQPPPDVLFDGVGEYA